MAERGRIALGVEYEGTAFSGWQSQPHAEAVQDHLEAALTKVADHGIRVVCAGRTDSGVHAMGQVAHFDTHASRPDHAWVLGTNRYLPPEISVRWASPVPGTFHARYSARWRRYRYVILNRRSRCALAHNRACWHCYWLDAERMQLAAEPLLGRHDFSAFRASACQARTPVRTIEALEIWRRGQFVMIDVRADAFLHHMVRNLAGTLMQVGRGEASTDWPAEVLAGGDRRRAGVTAPAAGLYLLEVGYPEDFDLGAEHACDPVLPELI